VTITSPGYPHGYKPNLNITWILHTESHYHIDIELIDIDFYPIRSSSITHQGDYLNVETGIIVVLFLFLSSLIIVSTYLLFVFILDRFFLKTFFSLILITNFVNYLIFWN